MKKYIQRIISLLLTVVILSSVLMVDVSAEPIFDCVREEWIETDDYSPDKYVWDDEIGRCLAMGQ